MSRRVGEALPGWQPPPRLGPVRMEGRRVVVSPLSPEAFPRLWEAFAVDDGEMWTYMAVGPFSSSEDLAATAAEWVGGTDPVFFTFDTPEGCGGWGSYLRIVPQHGVAEVGNLAFAPRFRRTAAATEAMYLMMRHVFDLGYRRYEWKCDSLNTASRRAAERLGFNYEGTFRRHMVYKGRNRDTSWYSIVDTEWPAVRAALEEWLDPANFDGGGRQRRRLSDIRPTGHRSV